MEIVSALLLLIVGVAVLAKSASWLVDGSVSLGLRFRISPMILGLTIVAFGTSLPELIVNVVAALQGASYLGIGNVFGANIVNSLLVLGLAAMIAPLKVHSNTAWKEIPFSVLTLVLFVVLISDQVLNGAPTNILERSDGMVLIILFLVFLYYLFLLAFFGINGYHEKHVLPKKSVWMAVLLIAIGIFGLFVGGQWVVDSSRALATFLGMTEKMIGLTVVALATTMPELTTTLIAARKGQTDLAVGNVVGSNIFNIALVLGVSAMIRPITISQLGGELVMLFAATLLLFTLLFIGDKFQFSRRDGKIMVSLFVLYFAVTLWRAAG